MSRKLPGAPKTRVYSTGDVIFREGDDPREECFLVHQGRVEIRKRVGDEDRVLAVAGKGELIGELGLFGHSPRSASAVAVSPVTVVVIPGKRLHHLVRTNPALAVALIRDLALKLLATDELLAAEGRRRLAERAAPIPPTS